MSAGTIFIQPHSDDIVMSSYFLIKSRLLPQPYYLLTVFGRSNWVDPKKRNTYEPINASRVTSIRRAEDEGFAQSLGLKLIFLDQPDCLLRENEVSYDPDRILDSSLLQKMKVTIGKILADIKIENIVTPRPSGGRQHYDHRITYSAIKLLSSTYNIFIVDDAPYSRITNPKENDLQIERKTDGRLVNKFEAMSFYDSQMCKLFFDQVMEITRKNNGYERLFTSAK